MSGSDSDSNPSGYGSAYGSESEGDRERVESSPRRRRRHGSAKRADLSPSASELKLAETTAASIKSALVLPDGLPSGGDVMKIVDLLEEKRVIMRLTQS